MKLADYLKANKITLETFAKQIGRDTSTISRLARGLNRPDWDTMQAIAEATNGEVQPNDFLEAASPSPLPAVSESAA
jgi:transcriptional regulator with XRE-family HTH domain